MFGDGTVSREAEILENIYSRVSESVTVKFTDNTQLTPLKDILNEVFKGQVAKPLGNVNDTTKKNLTQTQKDAIKAFEQREKIAAGINDLNDSKGGLLSNLSGFVGNIGKTLLPAGKMLLSGAQTLYKYGKEYFSNLKELRDNGVIIAEGFNDVFGLYAVTARMDHANFAKLLIANNKFIARMTYASDNLISGSKAIAKMAKQINGQYGLDEAQTISVLQFVTEITNTMNKRNITEDYLINQAEALAQTMSGLAAATGMSISQIKEKIKMDEQDLAERRIMQDPKRARIYMANKLMMGRDAALYAETGLANEKVLNMMSNPAQMQFLQNQMRISRQYNLTGNAEKDKKIYENFLHSTENNANKYIPLLRDSFSREDPRSFMLANDFYSNLYALTNINEIITKLYDLASDKTNPENQILEGMQMLNASVNIIRDIMITKVANLTDAETVGNILSSMREKRDNIIDLLVPDLDAKLKLKQNFSQKKLEEYEKKKNLTINDPITLRSTSQLASNDIAMATINEGIELLKKGKKIEEVNELLKGAGLYNIGGNIETGKVFLYNPHKTEIGVMNGILDFIAAVGSIGLYNGFEEDDKKAREITEKSIKMANPILTLEVKKLLEEIANNTNKTAGNTNKTAENTGDMVSGNQSQNATNVANQYQSSD